MNSNSPGGVFKMQKKVNDCALTFEDGPGRLFGKNIFIPLSKFVVLDFGLTGPPVNTFFLWQVVGMNI